MNYICQEVPVVLNQDIPRLSLSSCVKSYSKYNVIFNRWTKKNNKGIFQYNRTGNSHDPHDSHGSLACSLSRPLFGGFYVTFLAGAPNDNFRENICSEDDLRSRIFGTFVVKFLACLPLLGFSNI